MRRSGAVGRGRTSQNGEGAITLVAAQSTGHERQSDGDEGNEQPWLFHHDPVAVGSGVANKHSTRRSGASKLTRSLAIASWLPWCRGQLLEARFCRATASLSVEMSVFSSTDRGRGRGPALQCREGDHGRIIARSSAPRRPARLSQRVANAR